MLQGPTGVAEGAVWPWFGASASASVVGMRRHHRQQLAGQPPVGRERPRVKRAPCCARPAARRHPSPACACSVHATHLCIPCIRSRLSPGPSTAPAVPSDCSFLLHSLGQWGVDRAGVSVSPEVLVHTPLSLLACTYPPANAPTPIPPAAAAAAGASFTRYQTQLLQVRRGVG